MQTEPQRNGAQSSAKTGPKKFSIFFPKIYELFFEKPKKIRKFSVTDLDENPNNAAPWSSSHPREAATVQEPRSGLHEFFMVWNLFKGAHI